MKKVSLILAVCLMAGTVFADLGAKVVRTYNVAQFGDRYDGKTSGTINALAARLGSEEARFVIDQEFTVTNAVTTLANITMSFPDNGSLAVASGVTVTFNGDVEAGNHQIFSGLGTVVFQNKQEPIPEWWGVDGTDDEVQINAALDSVTSGVINLLGSQYNIGASIVMDGSRGKILRGNSSYVNPATSTNATTIRLQDGADCDMISVEGAVEATIEHLVLVGNKANQTSNSLAGIRLSSDFIYRCFVNNCHIREIAGSGIWTTRRELTGKQLYLYNCDRFGIYSSASSDVYLFDLQCGQNGEDGAYLKGTNYRLDGYQGWGNSNGLHLVNATDTVIQNFGCDVNDYNGLLVEATAGIEMRGVAFIGGRLVTASQVGDGLYSNAKFDGAGSLTDVSFTDVSFFSDENSYTNKPQYAFHDDRDSNVASELEGRGISFLGCSFRSGTNYLSSGDIFSSDRIFAHSGIAGCVDAGNSNEQIPLSYARTYNLPDSGDSDAYQWSYSPVVKSVIVTNIIDSDGVNLDLGVAKAHNGDTFKLINLAAGFITITNSATQEVGGDRIWVGQNEEQEFVFADGTWLLKDMPPSEYDNGNTAGSLTIDWRNGFRQVATLTGGSQTTAISASGDPQPGSVCHLRCVQGAPGTNELGEIRIASMGEALLAANVDTNTDYIVVNEDIRTGSRIRFRQGGGSTLPTGLTAFTVYWAINVDSTTIQAATSQANAQAGTEIDLTTDNVGTNQFDLLVSYPGGSAVDLSDPTDSVDFLTFYYDGAEYYCTTNYNFN